MDSKKSSWDCWFSSEMRTISFHEASGFQWMVFKNRTDLWTFVNALTREGYKVL